MARGITESNREGAIGDCAALGAGAPAGRAWPEAAVRVTFGVIWAIDASLKWQPGFRATIVSSLAATAAGEPHWLAPWFDLWLRLQRPDPWAWAYLVAVTETLLAACVLLGVARKLVYAAGAAYALIVWSTADGFGAPYGPGATDIGPAIIYSVVFCALLTMGAQGAAGRYSLDTLIARRVAWWHRLGWSGAD